MRRLKPIKTGDLTFYLRNEKVNQLIPPSTCMLLHLMDELHSVLEDG